jgi:ABC transport system ATP-binding/permease protein
MWKLVIEDDEGKRTVVHLTRDDYTIGRKDGHAIRLTERNVSRNHAKLIKKQDGGANGSPGYVLSDFESYNGVFVNGLRLVAPQEVQHGDLIQVGDYRVILHDDAATEAESAKELDVEDLKATVVPGRVKRPHSLTGQMLLARPNRLVMLVGPTPGEEYPLDKDRITVGRAEESTISINHNSVSRLHCEIHMLAESRFEIVDKGSSNGVRVNGSDLSRGIVEAGDLIELGDVRFKFVGAGQVFIPNASDSQRTAAISDREAGELLATKAPKPSILPFVLIGLVLGGAAVGAVYVATKMKAPPPTGTQGGGIGSTEPTGTGAIAAEPATASDMDTLSAASRERIGNPEGAYQKIAKFAPDSPARRDEKFAMIADAWADNRIKLAKSDPAQAPQLAAVAQSPDVSARARAEAQSLLAPTPTAVPEVSQKVIPVQTASATSTHDATGPGTSATHKTTATAPTPALTASVTAAKSVNAALAGTVASLVLGKKYQAARNVCFDAIGKGKLFSEPDIKTCRDACKGGPDDNPPFPPDSGCMNSVNNAKRP